MDMADPAATRAWCEAFRESLAAVATDCKSRRGLTAFLSPPFGICSRRKLPAMRAKGQNRPLKIMVVGDSQCGKVHVYQPDFREKGRKGGERPRRHPGQAVVTVDEKPLLFGHPGIPWPKFEDPEVASTGLHRGGEG